MMRKNHKLFYEFWRFLHISAEIPLVCAGFVCTYAALALVVSSPSVNEFISVNSTRDPLTETYTSVN
jgi:hypothetical protein